MKHRTLVCLRLLLLAVLALCWSIAPAGAQRAKVPQHAGEKTIVDAAGRVHERGAMRTTHAQRKAAAERMKGARIEAAKKREAELKQKGEVKK